MEDKEQGYRIIFEAASDGMIINDAETGRVVDANPAAIAMHGFTREEFIGLHLTAYIHPDSQRLFIESAHDARPGGIFDVPAVHLRKDGSSFYVDVRRTAIRFQARPCLLSVVRDVSERINAERLLHERVELHTREQAALLEISQTLASALELKPGLILDQLRVLVEYTHAELFVLEGTAMVALAVRGSQRLEETVPFRIHLQGPETLLKLFNEHQPDRIADVWSAEPSAQFLRSLLNDQADLLLKGVRAWMWVPVAVKNRVIGSVGVAHVERDYFTAHHADLALTVANQAAIALVNAELFEHAQALAAMQERQRLAQNLHDAVNQSLFSAGLIADVLPRLWDRDQDLARKSLIDLRRLTRAAQAEMRALLAELRPSAITDTDLGDLLHLLGNALSGRINIPVTVTVAKEIILPAEVQVAFYRVCQEALNNVAKHAEASQVDIDLKYEGTTVELRIRDDGKGFDPERTLSGHYGLGMMRERAEAVGALLTVTSRPSHGAELVMRWRKDVQKEA
ncbi:MAG: PAS domain S-box protein [Chloroflexi bacterium]|nr:PAS domain S-box protein [Chloroflexota bacterium]MBI1855439.1 PAS domain S-box protein [Chloroflexota bacterium]MBI3338823.1 PAS domain S-box protein [Chloroflexota bacterium]